MRNVCGSTQGHGAYCHHFLLNNIKFKNILQHYNCSSGTGRERLIRTRLIRSST